MNITDFIYTVANQVQDKLKITYKIEENYVRFYLPSIDRCVLNTVDIEMSEFYSWYSTYYCIDEITVHLIYIIESAWINLIRKE